MAIKELKKTVKMTPVSIEKDVEKFISQGGSLAHPTHIESDTDHRLTLRIPKSLMDKIDIKRKARVGRISRNLWILEAIQKLTKTL